MEDLDADIQQDLESLRLTSDDHPERVRRLQRLGARYYLRYQGNGTETDLDTAIQQFLESLRLTPSDHPERAHRLHILGIVYGDRYQRNGIETDLDTAIQQFLESLRLTPDNHPERASRLHSLGIGYADRYQRKGTETDLDTAIEQFLDSIRLTPDDHPEQANRFHSLGLGYHDRYRRKGSEADLDAAIQQFLESLRLTPDDHPQRANPLHSLGLGYYDKYERNGIEADLDTAIQQFLESLRLTPDNHLQRTYRLHSLGVGYCNRYLRNGTEADLDAAIQQFLESIRLTPDDHPERARRLQSLGTGYIDRYHRKGSEADLDIAIQQFLESLRLTPDDHPERASRLQSLGLGYTDRYQRKGSEADLDIAIQQFLESLRLTPDDHPQQAYRLYSLGVGYYYRSLRRGTETDLDIAIQQFLESLRLTPNNHPQRAYRLHSLGAGYRDRYHRKRSEADLDAAIEQFLYSLGLTPNDHPERARRLQSLGTGYSNRYQRREIKEDLDISIRQLLESLRLTPDDHPERAYRLHSLGIGYRDRYLRDRTEIDLDTAIQLFLESIRLIPDDHPEQANQFHSLGLGYHDRYRRKGIEADLDAAIQQFLESLRLTPDDHPQRASRLHSLGLVYHYRYLKNGTEADLDGAIQQNQESFDHYMSYTLDRLRSGVKLTRLYTEAKNWLSAHCTASTTVSLIALLTTRSLETSDRQNLVTEIAGLASDAAAIALNAEKLPYEAIRLLELGRGIIAASLDELRADIYDLQQKHPQLAEDYITLRAQLDAPPASVRQADELGFPADVTNQADQRHNTGQKLEQMIEDIRKLPSFERFLLAPTEDEMKAAASSGPIVVINVSDYRCDALIIEERGLQTLRLPGLDSKDVRARAATLEKPKQQLLEWLWDTVGKPVLDVLEPIQAPSSSWPRIWWIPTGPLTKFPLHAAGDHSCGFGNTVLDRVISSYSSSIRALIQSQQRRSRAKVAPEGSKAVLIGMEMTPNHDPLQYVPEEIEILSRLCRSMKLDVTIPQKRQKDVLSALRDCRIFHFAGHGLTDTLDPSRSSLILSDGPLTVASLFELNLHNCGPFLAYLSACGTGEIKHDILIDEALHLISACQLAGFRHVIGTLWTVNDHSCVEAAAMTYEWMKQGNMSDDSVAEGLHRASRHLRSQWNSESAARASKRMAAAARAEGSPVATEQSLSSQATTSGQRTAELCDDPPLYWIPYVHFGI